MCKNEIRLFKSKLLFQGIKYLSTFMKNKMFLLVIYAENKPSTKMEREKKVQLMIITNIFTGFIIKEICLQNPTVLWNAVWKPL
jgi:hypothetical protein